MNLRSLWYFLSAASAAGVSAGARRLGIAQSTMSAALGTLEEEIGAALFEKTPAGQRLTPAAIRLRDYATWLITEAEQSFVDLQTGNITSSEPITVFTYGVPRNSIADWATIFGAFESVAKNAPRAVFVNSDETGPENVQGDGLSISYLLEPRQNGDATDRVLLQDNWMALGLRDSTDLADEIEWERLLEHRLIVPPFAVDLGRAGASSARSIRSDSLALDPAGAPFTIMRRKDGVLLVPKTCLPAGYRARGVQMSNVVGAPLQPAVEVAWPSDHAKAARHLVDSICDLLHRSRTFSAQPAGKLRSLEARIDLHTYRCFSATAETGQTARAARACFIVQPALSMQIRKLETALSRQLFVRSGAGMTPTAAGLRLNRFLEPILQDHDTAIQRIREGQWADRQDRFVRLGIIPAADENSLIAEVAADVLSRWKNEHPDTAVSAAEGYRSVLLRWLRNHLIDFAIIDATEDQPDITIQPVFSESVALIFAAGSQWDNGEPTMEVGMLSPERVAIPSKRFGLRYLYETAFEEAGMRFSPSLEVDSLAITQRLVHGGEWATILPPSALHRQIRQNVLKTRILVNPTIERRICLATRSRVRLSKEVVSLSDDMIRAFGERSSSPTVSVLPQ